MARTAHLVPQYTAAPGVGFQPRHGRGGDDVPRFLRVKLGQYGGDAVEHAFDVHINHRVPVFGFQRGQKRGGHQTCVEENHVHFAKRFFGKGDKGGVVFGLDHVGYAVNRLAARRFDLVGNGFELVFAARAEHDFRAFAGKFECGGFADAAGRAGDDDDFVGDVLHGGTPWG